MDQKVTIEQKKKYLKSYLYARWKAGILEDEIRQFQLDEKNSEYIRNYESGIVMNIDCKEYTEFLQRRIQTLYKERMYEVNRYESVLRSIECIYDETEQSVLRLKYVHGKTLEETAEILNYSLRQINNIHKKALEHCKIENGKSEYF